ncbi:hypothetical protein [Myroides odoratimimus]|uniref:hypothetical protein n=1 Tax=Myroides odoratimimus TaxID=76832 RepID=UPI00310123DD
MKTQLAQQLKAILDQMPQDQFDQVWGSIVDMNMEGPSFDDAIEYFSMDKVNGVFNYASVLEAYNEPLRENQCEDLGLAA